MKKTVIVSGIIILFCSLGFAFNKSVDKKIHVSFTAVEWETKIQWMQICQEIMRKSSLPGNVISQYQDSLATFMNEAVKQLQGQIKADTVKPKK